MQVIIYFVMNYLYQKWWYTANIICLLQVYQNVFVLCHAVRNILIKVEDKIIDTSKSKFKLNQYIIRKKNIG